MGKARFLVTLAGILFASKVLAQVTLKIEGKGKCSEQAEVVVGREKNYLYHLQLPIGGTAEFKLPNGKYEVRAVTKSKCSLQKDFSYDGKPQNIIIILQDESKRKPAASEFGQSIGTGGIPANCVSCGPQINYYSPFMMPWNYSMFYPWYRNWGMPCMSSYGSYGCSAQQFPGGQSGPLMIGKPNIYFEGITKNLKVRIGDSMVKGLTVTVPAYGDKGWEVKTDGRMVTHKKVKYPYLFYDLRSSGEGLQWTNGFCGDRMALLNKMLEGLKKLSFPERSIQDFKDHWGTHFPEGRDFCVLPQVANDLEKSAPIEFSVPTTFTRVVYVVLPSKILPDEPLLDPVFKDYKPLTLKDWDPWAIKPAKDKVRAYEWGLAFTFTK